MPLRDGENPSLKQKLRKRFVCWGLFSGLISIIFALLIIIHVAKYKEYNGFSRTFLSILWVTGLVTTASTLAQCYICCCCICFLWTKRCKFIRGFLSVTVQIFLIICAGVVLAEIMFNLKDNMIKAMDRYKTDLDRKVSWDYVQEDFKCCGLNNYTEWFGKGDLGDSSVPDSCCMKHSEDCGENVKGKSDLKDVIYTRGCDRAGFVNFVHRWALIIAGMGIGMNVLNIIHVWIFCGEGQSFETSHD